MSYKITTETEVDEAYCVKYSYENGDFRDPPSHCEKLFLTEEEARKFISVHLFKRGYTITELYKKSYLNI